MIGLGGTGSGAGEGTIGYGQCWEDADVLVQALDVKPGDRVLSIAAAGDNALALLTRDPGQILAIDRNPAQLACLEIRVAAYRALGHAEMLELHGARPSMRRRALYRACRSAIPSMAARAFWDRREDELAQDGFAGVGRLERYMKLFRRWLLPFVHGRRRVADLLRPRDAEGRRAFFDNVWNTGRWRGLFRIFFSRTVMARLGRAPACFDHVDGDVAEHLLHRTASAMTDLDPAANPYLTWILTGRFGSDLPLALRAEHFETIRDRLGRLTWRAETLADTLRRLPGRATHRFNLSDVFEYLSPGETADLLNRIADTAVPGGRAVYWNMMVPRNRPAALADRLTPLKDLAGRLWAGDRAFFYRRLVIEEAA